MIYCRAPWIGYVVNPNDINCCCHYEKKQITIEEKRIMIYNNNIPSLCKQCGFRKLYFNKKYDDIFKKNFENFDINNGKIKKYYPGHVILVPFFYCNAKCINCNTYKNKKILNINILKNDNIDLSLVKFIILQGGELTLNNKILDYLKFFPENVEISMMTNGMIYNKDIFNFLNKKNATLTISIDGYMENNDILRPGTKYKTIVNNINKIIFEYKNIKIEISLIVNKINAFSFKDDIIKIQNDIKSKINFCIAPVIFPNYLSINSLSYDKKQQFLKYISNIPIDKINKILNLTINWELGEKNEKNVL